MIKLYGSKLSPFAARLRAAIYFKGIKDEIELAYPPAALNSAEWLAINPLGKIPALATNGRVLVESQVIMEYLDDRFPESSLRPENIEDRALARTLDRVCDVYIFSCFQIMFRELRSENPNHDLVNGLKPKFADGLAFLNRVLPEKMGPYILGDKPTVADCTVPTTLFLIERFLVDWIKDPDVFTKYDRINAYWKTCRDNEVINKVFDQMAQGYESLRTTGRAT